MISCSKENESLGNQEGIKKQIPSSLLNIISAKKTQNSSFNRPSDSIRFDYDNIKETYNNNGLQAFTANQYRIDTKNRVNYGECYFLENGVVIDSMIIGTEIISKDLRAVNYFETDWTKFLVIQVDNITRSSTTTFSANRNAQCTGANVMGCITDAYSDHGWTSVFAGVASAFFPQVAVAITIACAAKNKC